MAIGSVLIPGGFAMLLATFSGSSMAQAYPSKTIRIITSGAGSTTDFTARLVAQELSKKLGQAVIVDNRTSAVITADFVAKAPADGYVLLLSANSLWVGSLFERTSYDPIADFVPVSMVAGTPNLMVVHPSLPVKSVKEVIVLAKRKPGELNYASSSIGTTSHIAGELFKAMAGLDILRIPYTGGGPSLNAVVRGEVHLLFSTPAAVPYVTAGRLRALAITTPQRSELFPGLPTIAESGLPGYSSSVSYALFAPGKTAEVVVNRLNKEIVQMAGRHDVKEKFLKVGVEPIGSSPHDLALAMRAEMSSMSKIIKRAGISSE